MPTRTEKWTAGTPCWVDVAVPDVTGATEFYGPVLGWTFHDTGEQFGHYTMCLIGGRTAAGIGRIQMPGQAAAWTQYLASDDADATAQRVTASGGSVAAGPFDIPDVGRMAVAVDPTGAEFGIWQAHPKNGIEVFNEPGGLVWEDARLTDPDAGRAFYAAVFGYHYTPIDDAPGYTVFGPADAEPYGGIGGLEGAPEGTPGHWLPYFGVPSVDQAIAAALAGGGSVLSPAEDSPYGRMATVADPYGALFAVHQELTGQP